jgi:hypothetical protein
VSPRSALGALRVHEREQDGHTAARRLPHRINRTRSGSASVEYAICRPVADRCSTRPRSRTGWEQCPHWVTCSAHRSKSARPARVTICSTVCGGSVGARFIGPVVGQVLGERRRCVGEGHTAGSGHAGPPRGDPVDVSDSRAACWLAGLVMKVSRCLIASSGTQPARMRRGSRGLPRRRRRSPVSAGRQLVGPQPLPAPPARSAGTQPHAAPGR